MAYSPLAVWANMTVKTWPESYWLIDIDKDALPIAAAALEQSAGRYSCIIRDQFGFSLVVDAATWQELSSRISPRQKFGPLKVISTDSPLPFDVVGFIGAALREINGAGFKAAPQCGAAADHFFTGERDIAAVENLFKQLIDNAKAAQ